MKRSYEDAFIPIQGASKYEMNKEGAVRNVQLQSFIKPTSDKTARLYIDNGKRKDLSIEKLVREHFPTIVENEVWKRVENWPYEVSNIGRVRRNDTLRLLSPVIDGNGYAHVCLKDGVRRFNSAVHQLVAFAFLPEKPHASCTPNHKNHVRDDNNLDNLEWLTPSEQVRDVFEMKGSSSQKKVLQLNEEMKVVNIFESVKKAAIDINLQIKSLMKHIKNQTMFQGFYYDLENKVNNEDLVGEQWKDVLDYEGFYKVSNKGRIKNKSGSILKPCLNQGYNTICIYKGKEVKPRMRKIHVLEAEAFLTKPLMKGENEKFVVNHINSCRINNYLSNLEWVTQKENTQLAVGFAVSQFDSSGKWVADFPSISEASKTSKISQNRICAVYHGRKDSVDGFVFKKKESKQLIESN